VQAAGRKGKIPSWEGAGGG